MAHSFREARSENPTPLSLHLPCPAQFPNVSQHGRRIPSGNGRDGYGQGRSHAALRHPTPPAAPGTAQGKRLHSLTSDFQGKQREKQVNGDKTTSRLISRANKGKSRCTETKPHPWKVGRSGEGAEVTPLPAGNSIPCYSPAWVCLIPSQLPSPGSWQNGRRLGGHLPGEKYHRRNSYTGVNLIKPPPIVYFNIALVTEIIKMDSAAKLISSFPF